MNKNIPGSREESKRFLNILAIIALFIFCILGMGYLLVHRMTTDDSTHSTITSEGQSENRLLNNTPNLPSKHISGSDGSVGYRVGYKLLYDAPKTTLLYIRGGTDTRTLVIKSGKHPAEVLKYNKKHNRYAIGIEITPGILITVYDVPPSQLYRMP